MSISPKSIQLMKTVLAPFIDAGALPATEYTELMAAITRPEKPEPAKATTTLITREAGAKMLGISARSLDRLLRDGTLRPIHVGKRSIRLNLTELSNFMNVPAQTEQLTAINSVAQPLTGCQLKNSEVKP